MSKEQLEGKSAQHIAQKQSLCVNSTAPQNVTVILPAFNEEVSVGSVVLLTRYYADSVIVVDDGSSNFTTTVTKLIQLVIESVAEIICNGSKEPYIFQPRFRSRLPDSSGIKTPIHFLIW